MVWRVYDVRKKWCTVSQYSNGDPMTGELRTVARQLPALMMATHYFRRSKSCMYELM